jgi:hypothetical protein
MKVTHVLIMLGFLLFAVSIAIGTELLQADYDSQFKRDGIDCRAFMPSCDRSGIGIISIMEDLPNGHLKYLLSCDCKTGKIWNDR